MPRLARVSVLVASLLAASLLATGCDEDPADVAGNYTLSLTNGQNGCNFANWTEGDTSTGVPLTVTQAGESITGTVGGAGGIFLNLWLGDNVYSGTVKGSDLRLTLYGTVSNQTGNCTFTVNSNVAAEINGDVLVGTIRYTAATNGNPDCAPLEGCASLQSFNGTRPPQ